MAREVRCLVVLTSLVFASLVFASLGFGSTAQVSLCLEPVLPILDSFISRVIQDHLDGGLVPSQKSWDIIALSLWGESRGVVL